MTCPQCRHENRGSAKFCEECGAGLPRRCSACGTELRAAARFCDECGTPVGGVAPAPPSRPGVVATSVLAAAPPSPAPAAASVAAVADRLAARVAGYTPRHLAEKILTSRGALEGERKQVSVLFADCVGFTELARGLDPEELHQVMDGCFRHLLDTVHRYEGTVNQFTGDGVMALFGAPVAHEDHAIRAVAAALAAQTALRDYAAVLRRERGIEFSLRIGINTGPVVVGKIGDDLRMDYTAQGETVNLAARLQQVAPAGGVLVSEGTHRLIAGFFRTEDGGERTIKGLDHGVRTFVVTGQRTRRVRFDLAVERGLTPLVGRDRQLALLEACWDRARAGEGQVVSIVGEAGIGKSRLAYEFRGRLDPGRATCVEGRCAPHAAAVPFHLVVEVLHDHFGLQEADDERARADRVEQGVRRLDPALEWTVPYLKHLLALPAPEVDAAGLDQAQRKRRLSEAVRTVVLRGARRRPLLLLAEDLQWIDPNSEELFHSLVDSLAGYPVLLVCTHRGGYAPPWHDRSHHQRLALDPLSDEESGRLVAALGAGLDPAQRALVLQRGEGNAFFIEELTRYLGERHRSGDVPASVHDLITARIDRLPEPLKRTLQLAAVLGREFRLSLLEALAPAPGDVESHVAELVRQDLLRQKDLFPEPTYSFRHLLIQEVAHQGLLLKSRAELHTRAGDALARRHGDSLDDVVDQLAEHYAHGTDALKAMRYLTLAGDRAARLFAYPEAERAYLRALERAGDGGDRATLAERIGDVAFAHGALKTALGRWDEARHLVTDVRRRADVHRKMAAACWASGQTQPALAHLEEGLAVLGTDTSNLEAARLYHELGRIHFRLGEHARATEWARRALELGQRLDAADVVSHAYNTLGVAAARAGDLGAGATFVEQSLAAALAHDLGAVACRAYTNLAVMYATLDPARSERCCREGLALAEKIGDRLQQAWLYCVLAGGHCTLSGQYDEGIQAAEAAVDLDERLGQDNHLPVPLIILAQVHQCRGDHERSEHFYQRALAIARTVAEPQLLVPCYEGLATLAIERDDEAAAEAWLAKSREVQRTTGWTSESFQILPFLA